MTGNRRQLISWCLYDFANSSYSAVIAAVLFPFYYATVIVGNEQGLGDLWWGRAVAFSMAFVAITSPFLGGIADYSGRRKMMLGCYTVLCISAVASFTHLKPGMIHAGFFLAVAANIGMEGGIVFYNSYLPDITTSEYHGRLSAWGFAVGYLGSIVSLLASLALVREMRYDTVWLMVAIFFLTFSLPAFLWLPRDRPARTSPLAAARQGAGYFLRTFRSMMRMPELRRFLLAYLVYEDGVNTIIVFSGLFAASTLGFSPVELVKLYLLVQVTALIGAMIMAKPIDYYGPKKVVLLSLILWIASSATAYFIVTKTQFWVLATAAGLGLGTVQAASRAFFTQFVPPDHESEYFGVYAMVGKSSAVIGPFLFGFISSATRSQRPAILSVATLFLIGFLLVHKVRAGGPNIRNSSDGSNAFF